MFSSWYNRIESPQVALTHAEAIARFHDAMGRYRVRLERKAIRRGEVLSPVWTDQSKDELIYLNVKTLLAVFNDHDHWEALPTPAPALTPATPPANSTATAYDSLDTAF